MPADNGKVKEQLIAATIKLLSESDDPGKITARQIASEADANLAMINYYFSSKDALVSMAVDRIIADRAAELEQFGGEEASPRDRLKGFFIKLSDIAVKYSELTRPSIPYLLMQGEIEQPYHILPFVRECCGASRSEAECRIIAYQLVSFSQLVFYRSDDFMKYLGFDIRDKKQRDDLLEIVINLFIPVPSPFI